MAQCHLSWDTYTNNICKGFSRLQQSEELVDMTIAADGYLVKAHKALVALASPYIMGMIQSAPCPHPVIYLNNVSREILSYILEYVYNGEVNVPTDKMDAFIKTAKGLAIVGVTDIMAPLPSRMIRKRSQLQQNLERISRRNLDRMSQSLERKMRRRPRQPFNVRQSTRIKETRLMREKKTKGDAETDSDESIVISAKRKKIISDIENDRKIIELEDTMEANTICNEETNQEVLELPETNEKNPNDSEEINPAIVNPSLPETYNIQDQELEPSTDNRTVDQEVKESIIDSAAIECNEKNQSIVNEATFSSVFNEFITNTGNNNVRIEEVNEKDNEDTGSDILDISIGNLLSIEKTNDSQEGSKPNSYQQLLDNLSLDFSGELITEEQAAVESIRAINMDNAEAAQETGNVSTVNCSLGTSEIKTANYTIALANNVENDQPLIGYTNQIPNLLPATIEADQVNIESIETEFGAVQFNLVLPDANKMPNAFTNSDDKDYFCSDSDKTDMTIDNQYKQDNVTDNTVPVYVISNRRNLQMILNRYMYGLHHSSEKQKCPPALVKRRWRCVQYRRINCRAFVDTVDEKIVARKNLHTHPFEDEKIIYKGQNNDHGVFESIADAQNMINIINSI